MLLHDDFQREGNAVKTDGKADTGVYATIQRLVRLRAVIHATPQSFSQICTRLPDDYTPDPSGQRKLLRDVQALRAFGYTIQYTPTPAPPRWQIRIGPPLLSDTDVQALRYIRAAFPDGSPYTPPVKQVLDLLTALLTPEQRREWEQPLTVQLATPPVQDYQRVAELLQWLEQAMRKRQQISLRYKSSGREQPIWHPRLDPYQIVYRDEQFFLEAFSYRSNRILPLRLDRIVYDRQSDDPSPIMLPSLQPPRRTQPELVFTYRLPLRFTREGVSARFTILDVQDDDTHSTITASHPNLLYIVRTLLGYGKHTRLLAGPPELLDRFYDEVQGMWAQFGDDNAPSTLREEG